MRRNPTPSLRVGSSRGPSRVGWRERRRVGMLGRMEFTIISCAQAAAVLASEPRPPGGLAAKYHVTLTEEERTRLEALTQAGRVAARTVWHAWILVKADARPGAPA